MKSVIVKRKTEFGADKEADNILGKLPRRVGVGALVWIDAAGRLCIAIDGGGLLSIREDDLYKVHGDELYEG